MVTMCGRNFGFDKTMTFKESMVTVEVAGASCKRLRQDYINRCGRVSTFYLRPWQLWPQTFVHFRSPCDCKRQSALNSHQEHPRRNFLIILFQLSLAFVPPTYIRNRFPGTKAVKEWDCCAHYPKTHI